MVFWLSKVLWFLFSPGNLVLLALVLGLIFLAAGWRRLGGWLAGTATAMLLAIAVLPLDPLLAQLEDRFPQYTSGAKPVDGILVLGGSINPRISMARGQVNFQHGERLTAFVALARRYPRARLVFSGGTGSLNPGPMREADIARKLFAALGLDVNRVIFERESRNTFENAEFSKALVKPKKGENWLLITSAFHMPRAIGCFRRVGWNVTAFPVDYLTDGTGEYSLGFALNGGLRAIDLVAHEWLGLAAYYLMGRTSELFPAPKFAD